MKERIVRARGFENIRLRSEDVAEFAYRPTACRKTYRLVMVRKNLSVEEGEQVLFDDLRYFSYLTNDTYVPADEIVLLANARCNPEYLIEQLENGVRAMPMPVDNLLSNWTYMVMASPAWTLTAWFALSLPETGRWAAKYKSEKSAVLGMEFEWFLNGFMRVPCQIVRSGRRMAKQTTGDLPPRPRHGRPKPPRRPPAPRTTGQDRESHACVGASRPSSPGRHASD